MGSFTKGEKIGLGVFGSVGCLALLFALTLMGLGVWGLVEIILWIKEQ